MSMSMSNSNLEMKVYVKDSLVDVFSDFAKKCIEECGEKYGFDWKEAVTYLGLERIELASNKGKKLKDKAAEPNVTKYAFPLPYNGELNGNNCYALRLNNGLFTQCTGVRK